MDGFALVKDKNAYDGGIIWRKCGRRDWSRLRGVRFRGFSSQGNRIKKPPSFCIRQCGEDIFTTMLTAGGNKWGIVCKKKVAQSLSKSCICR